MDCKSLVERLSDVETDADTDTDTETNLDQS